jgi:hypothetical protein
MLVLCLVGSTVPSIAHERFQQVREIRDTAAEFREHCGKGERITIRLRDASTIQGTLAECKSNRLEIVAEPTNRVRTVRYSDMSAFLDPDTGAVIAIVAQPPKRLRGDTKILLGIGIGLAVLVVWAYLNGLFVYT